MGSNSPMLDLAGYEREFGYCDADFGAIASILRAEAGIALPAGKASLVYARLIKRLRALEFSNFADYVALLQGTDGEGERRHMVAALTTNVTRFFREPHHFDHLRTEVLRDLVAKARRGARVRLWSAGCSTGQEPYSIAALIAAFGPAAARLDIKILATDIDPNVLEHAAAGHYTSIEGMPPDARRWFPRQRSGWQADPAIRNLVTFRQVNLNSPWPMRGPFDVVFCRNVAIYFDQELQSRLWQSFADVVPPDGCLYIGHAERVTGPAASRFQNIGITTYRRRKNHV